MENMNKTNKTNKLYIACISEYTTLCYVISKEEHQNLLEGKVTRTLTSTFANPDCGDATDHVNIECTETTIQGELIITRWDLLKDNCYKRISVITPCCNGKEGWKTVKVSDIKFDETDVRLQETVRLREFTTVYKEEE